MDELSMVTGAVISSLTGGALKAALAPADAVAEVWKERIKARLDRVDDKTRRKRGNRQSIAISERTAFKALVEGAFTDDNIVAEYLAGVIAGSREANDDAGVPWLAQIGRLSAMQLCTHYIVYRGLWKLVRERRLSLIDRDYGDRPYYWHKLFFPESELNVAIGAQRLEPATSLGRDLEWLSREGLIAEGSQFVANGEELLVRGERGTIHIQPPEGGWVVQITEYGIQLFLWGCGSYDREPLKLEGVSEDIVSLDPELPSCDPLPYAKLPYYL